MKREQWLVEVALRMVPAEWRDGVLSDLREEDEQHVRGRRMRVLWLSWHALAVGARLRLRRMIDGRRMRMRRTERRVGFTGGLGTDARLALRSVQRRPWSALTIALTLGLGIGSATATYAVFNEVVLRPLSGVVDEGRFVTLYYQIDASTPNRTSVSYAHFEAMRDQSGALDGLVAWARSEAGFATNTTTAPDVVTVTAVTDGYFDVLGVRARTGRFFSGDEYTAGDRVIVISERFAGERFAGDGAPIGRQVYLNGVSFTVIGVAADFRGVDRFGGDDVWTPYRTPLEVGAQSATPGVFTMFGRLRSGATLEQAQEQVREASLGVGPRTIRGSTFEPILFRGLTDGIGLIRSQLMRMYRLLMAGTAILFLLACANAANLLLARNLSRRGALAIRAAIGADRMRLVRELATESVGLALIAGAFGLAIALLLTGLFRGTHLLAYLPALEQISIDWRVVTFCAGAATATVLFFGVGPALAASRVELSRGLGATDTAAPRAGRARAVLVAVQLALALTLFANVGLLTGTAWRLQTLDLGLDADDVVTFRLRPYEIGRDEARTDAILRETHERLAAVEGFDGVALSWDGPFSTYQRLPVSGPDGSTSPTNEIAHFVSADYFATLRIPIISGRSFTPAEERRAANETVLPVVLNESFAREWFGSTGVIGRTVTAQYGREDISLEIVGLAGDVRYRELREGFVPMIYLPAEGRLRLGTLLIRSSLPPTQVMSIARGIVHEIDPLLPVSEVGNLREDVAGHLAEERLLARFGVVIASLAGLLAVAGLYAVIAFVVHERVREFAIRMAVGASGRNIGVHVIRRVLAIAALGIAFGLVMVVATSRVLASRLYGVGPLDPLTIGAATLVLTAAGLFAAWLPARRAAKIDPMVSLRLE